jgi:hypothetical protein
MPRTKLYFVVCKNGKHHYSNDNGQPVVGELMPLLLADLDKNYPECSPHSIKQEVS